MGVEVKTKGKTKKESIMNTNVAVRSELSAKQLGWIMSFIGCTACAVIYITLMEVLSSKTVAFPNLFAVFFLSYSQLIASTLQNSPVERHGKTVKGMIFSDSGDDYIHESIRCWMWFWFISPFLYSTIFTAIGVFVLYAFGHIS